MTTFHAVVWIDHQSAQVLQFDEIHVESHRVKAHLHHTRQHGHDTRGEHAYYDQVAQALAGVQEVLVVGPGHARDEFLKHCQTHQRQIARCIVDTQPVEHPTEAQLVALARKYFARYDLMAGTPTPV